jgi:nitrite reductase/ring-hydroxylating ferredoxin subunit
MDHRRACGYYTDEDLTFFLSKRMDHGGHTSSDNPNCTLDCSLVSNRRAFLREAALAAAAALVAFGLSPQRALAAPLELIAPLATNREKLTYAIPSQDGATVDKDHRVVVMRWENSVYALSLTCPHQNTVLRWREDDRRFQCPKHQSKYQPDGTFISGRATRGIDRYAITREGDNLIVDTDILTKESEDRAAWLAAFVKL